MGCSCFALSAAFVTALIMTAFIFPSSRASKPSIVVPAGVTTMSFSFAGCSPVSMTIFAEPNVVWAASCRLMSLGKPRRKPASASESIIR